MATKKSAQKTAPVKKRTTTRKKAPKAVDYKSFRATSSSRPFMSFSLTQQTFYWAVISLAVLALGLYVISLQIKVNDMYDQVDANSSHIEYTQQELQKIQEANSQQNP